MTEPTNLTFLFTDIEGSTSKWEEQPEQMAQAVGRHDALLRDAVHASSRARSSRRPATASTPRSRIPADCLAAVIEIQLALLDPAATAGMRVARALRHATGAVQARDNDYFGSTINRTARIMSAAHGGQVLVSQAVAERCAIAAGRRVAERPRQRAPEGPCDGGSRYQVVHPKLYQNFPALRELEATPNNLPQQLTSFIGRERELAGDRGAARQRRAC